MVYRVVSQDRPWTQYQKIVVTRIGRPRKLFMKLNSFRNATRYRSGVAPKPAVGKLHSVESSPESTFWPVAGQ